MPSTPRGITYPDSSGHTRIWEHLQALADTADDAIDAAIATVDRTQSGKATASTTGTTTGTVSITFPQAFTAAPHIVATATLGSFNVAVTALSDTGATFTIRHVDAANTSSSTDVHWIAVGTILA